MKHVFLAIVLLFFPGLILAQENVNDVVNESVEAGGDAENVVAPVAPARQGNIFGVDFRNLVAAKRFQLTQVFLVEVDEISRVCTLDGDQVTRLTIGARGAVKKLLLEWEKQTILRMAIYAANNPAVSDAIEEAKGAFAQTGLAIDDAGEIDETTLQFLKDDLSGGSFAPRPETESQFWVNTVASVLTVAQASRLDEHRQKRVAAKRQATIAMCMSTLEYELGLNDEQRTRLLALVVPEVEEIRINCSPIDEMHMIYYFIFKIDADNQADAILSPAQLQKLKMFLAPHKNICQKIEHVVEKEKFRVELLQTWDLPNQPGDND